jgi:hypothetical protein
MNFKTLSCTIAASTLIILAGCSTPAPPYAVSIPNVQTLKNSNAAPVSVGEVTAQPSVNNDSIGVRANSMNSPKGTFAKYLQDALSQELADAKLLDPKSDIQVTAVLTKNDISAAGFITNSAIIAARFTVKRGGKVTFDKVKEATTQWDSNFIGAIAIPRAIQNYPTVVTALLKQLYEDKEFSDAIKK